MWVRYINRRGSINVGTRVEQSAALLATLFANSKSSKKYKIEDFMAHEERKEVETLEQAMKEWS